METPSEECPICLEPFPADTVRGNELTRSWKHTMCCGNAICKGCFEKMRNHSVVGAIRRVGVERMIANLQQGRVPAPDDIYCPLCRYPVPKTFEGEFKLVLKRAKNGRVWAQCMVGARYTSGLGVKKDEVEGARWFKRAAEAGNIEAMDIYAECCRIGSGVPISMISAKYWFEKASNAGNAITQYKLGVILTSNIPGIPADPVEAARLFRMSADQDYDLGLRCLGDCYFTGQGVEKDIEQALHWYGEASSQGNTGAMHNYGNILLNNAEEKYGGIHLTGKSPIPQSLYWFRKAAAGGNADSATNVAFFEPLVSSQCKQCGVRKDACEKLLKCQKCKAVYYCGRSCQVKNWQLGHKIDCGWKENSTAHALMQSPDSRSAT